MKRNRIVPLMVVLTIVAVAWGCRGKSAPNAGPGGAAAPAAKVSTAKQPVEGSHEDRTYINMGAHLSPYKAVYVAPPTMDTTADRNEKVDDFLKRLQANIRTASVTALRGSGKFQLVTDNERDARARGKYLVYRNDVLVHFGSTAARWVIGMGAGRSKLIVVPSLEDPGSKDVVLKYTGWGGSVAGLGFEVLDKMQADVFSIENYFGGLVRKIPN